MKFITDEVLYGSKYVEAYTGLYYYQPEVSTCEECRRACASSSIYISKGYKLTEIDKIPETANCVLVQFSKEEDYTEPDYRIMTVQKKYLKRFLKNLAEY
jgi:hypothetical protein